MIFVDILPLLWWGRYLRKSGRGEIWGHRQRCLSLSSLFTPDTNFSQSHLSPAGYPLGVCSHVIDGCHCSTPFHSFHILKRQLSKANKQSCCHSALKHHCVMWSLSCLVSMFYSQTQPCQICMKNIKAFQLLFELKWGPGRANSMQVICDLWLPAKGKRQSRRERCADSYKTTLAVWGRKGRVER